MKFEGDQTKCKHVENFVKREKRLGIKDRGTQKSLTVADTTGFRPLVLNAWSRKHGQHKRYLGL